METKFVDSSMISEIKYENETGTLHVVFKNGGVEWQYYDFPEHLWNEFQYAESHGKYFNANIKDQYRGGRLN